MTELETPGTGAKPTRKRDRRMPWLLGGILLAVLKSEAVVKLLFHRGELVGVMAVWLVVSVLKPRPAGIAIATSVLAACLIAPHSLGLGIPVGFGAFAVLVALFFTVSTLLHAAQRRARP